MPDQPRRRHRQRSRFVIFISILGVIFFSAYSDHTKTFDIGSLHNRLLSGDIPNLHSVLVIQHGEVIAEWYFEGIDEEWGIPLPSKKFGPELLHDVRSVTKSIVSLLFGIAMADHAVPDLDSPVLDFFPECKDLQTPERRKIRLRDLLTMTSGLQWDERSYPYTDIRNGESAMNAAPDRYRYILSRPMDSTPGTHWRYSGGDVALIAAIIARSTKTPIDSYAANKLFHPLGITEFNWIADDKKIPIAASGLRMLPRDMAKIGLLVLHQGQRPKRSSDRASALDSRINRATRVRINSKQLHNELRLLLVD